jgi:hypothetical protein
MSDKITEATVRKMRRELDQLDAQAEYEMKARNTKGLGLLRKELIAECRHRLTFITVRLKVNR